LGGFENHARLRFAALASGLVVVRAVIGRVDRRAFCRERFQHPTMHFLQRGFGDLVLGNAALIGNDDDAKASAIQQRDAFGNSRENVEVCPMGDVLTFDRPLIDNSVPIQKDGAIHEFT
jgi:hypothetical protein